MSNSSFPLLPEWKPASDAKAREGPTTAVFLSDLDRLVNNCALHRTDLLRKGKRRLRMKRFFSVLAGTMALLSAGTVAGVLADLLGPKTYQVFAAITAALSGVITLVSSAYLVDEETVTILDASSKYLALRDLINRVRVAPKLTDEDRFTRMEQFQKEYTALDERYSRFL